MMTNYVVQGFLYGHPIHIRGDEYTVTDENKVNYTNWRFTETGEPTENSNMFDLVCPQCGKQAKDFDGHDPCIANLPNVKAACCGHGVEDAYIVFNDGTTVRGTDEVMKVVNELRNNMKEEL